MEIPPAQLEWAMKNLPRRAQGLLNSLEIQKASILYPKDPLADLAAYKKWLASADEWLRLYMPEEAKEVGFLYSDFRKQIQDAPLMWREVDVPTLRLDVRGELQGKLKLLDKLVYIHRSKLSPKPVEPKSKLSAKYNNKTAKIMINGVSVDIPPNSMQSRLCEVMFKPNPEVPVDVDYAIDHVLGTYTANDTGKDQERMRKVAIRVQKKLKEKLGITENLFSFKRSVIVRLF